MTRKRVFAPLLVIALVLGAGCNNDNPSRPKVAVGDEVPDFALTDVNPNSATHDSTVSPRDELGDVSAWYFGHST
jgi:hypothetical protein